MKETVGRPFYPGKSCEEICPNHEENLSYLTQAAEETNIPVDFLKRALNRDYRTKTRASFLRQAYLEVAMDCNQHPIQ